MEVDQQQQTKHSKVVKVDSKTSWDSHVNRATARGCAIVVHFAADWCVPSVAMKSFFEELASNYVDVLFVTVDVDAVKEVATKYEVKAMPTFVLLKDGAPVDKLVGANPDEIKKRIESLVQPSSVTVV